MCIRDSGSADVARNRPRTDAGRTGRKAANAVGKGPQGDEAVSYTHLRAHETVLDLVCRLLLEKKKTQKP